MPQPETSLHFNEYFRIIRNRLWVIFTIFALTLVSGIYVTEQVLPKKLYRLGADPDPERAEQARPALGRGENSTRPIDPIEFQTEYERINSPGRARSRHHKLGLDKVWAKRIYKSARLTSCPLQDARNYLNSILSQSSITAPTSSKSPAKRSAEGGADIANAVVDSYKELRDGEQIEQQLTGADTLRSQIADQEKVVDATRRPSARRCVSTLAE